MSNEQNHPELSEREQQLIELAAQGFTDTAISHQLGISEATVSTYWGRIRIKLGPHSRTELVAMAINEENERVLDILRKENQRLQEELRLRFGVTSDLSHNFYQQLLENAPDAILVIRSDGTIESANPAVEPVFGFKPEELIGESMECLLPERFHKIHAMHREDYVKHPEKRPMGDHLATLAKRKDGSEFPIAASISPIQTEAGIVVMCIARDVSGSRPYMTAPQAAS